MVGFEVWLEYKKMDRGVGHLRWRLLEEPLRQAKAWLCRESSGLKRFPRSLSTLIFSNHNIYRLYNLSTNLMALLKLIFNSL